MLGLQTFIQQHTEFMWHLGLSPTQEVLCVRQALLPLSYIPAQPRTIFTTSSIDPFENIDSKTYAALSNVDQLLYTLFLIAFNNITTNLIRKCSEACKLKMKENDFPKFWFFFIWKLKLLLAKEKEDNWFSWSDKLTLFILKEASATHSCSSFFEVKRETKVISAACIQLRLPLGFLVQGCSLQTPILPHSTHCQENSRVQIWSKSMCFSHFLVTGFFDYLEYKARKRFCLQTARKAATFTTTPV